MDIRKYFLDDFIGFSLMSTNADIFRIFKESLKH